MAAAKKKETSVTISIKEIVVEIPRTTISGANMKEVTDQLKALMLEALSDVKLVHEVK